MFTGLACLLGSRFRVPLPSHIHSLALLHTIPLIAIVATTTNRLIHLSPEPCHAHHHCHPLSKPNQYSPTPPPFRLKRSTGRQQSPVFRPRPLAPVSCPSWTVLSLSIYSLTTKGLGPDYGSTVIDIAHSQILVSSIVYG